MAATLCNMNIAGTAKHAKVHPHVCEDGRYPPEFNTPKTVEVMKVLDSMLSDFATTRRASLTLYGRFST